MKSLHLIAITLSLLLINSQGLAESNISDTDLKRINQLKNSSSFFQKYKQFESPKKRYLLGFLANAGEAELLGKLLDVDTSISVDTAVMNYTLLTRAASKGKLNVVQLLLERGANIELKNASKDTPLKAAAREGQLEVVRYLLQKGANANVTGSKGSTPLTSATYGNHLAVIALLLKNGAILKQAENKAEWSLLHYAANYNHTNLIQYYLEKGLDINKKSASGWTALALAADKGFEESVKELLKHNNIKVDLYTKRKSTPLILAAANGHTKVVKLLLDARANINAVNRKKHSAVWWAASEEHVEALALLKEQGADVKKTIAQAAKYDQVEVLKNLLAVGVKANTICNKKGASALQVGARYGNLDVVKLFLKKGIDINAQESGGKHTALMRASAFGKKLTVKYLLKKGADTHLLTTRGWSAFSLASRYGHLDIAKLIYAKGGIDINESNNKGWTPLMLATRGKHPDIVEYLLKQGADKALENDGMKTALDLTKKYKNRKVIHLLK